MKPSITTRTIESKIYLIRGQKVMLDSDVAELYGVATKVLVQSVKRNSKRFPADFMFQLAEDEDRSLRSHIVTLKKGRGSHRKYRAHVFTEQGVAMLSSVLKSERAIEVNIGIMRAFVKLREMIATHKDLAAKLDELEQRYDAQFKLIFDAIRALMLPPTSGDKKIGFIKEEKAEYRVAEA